MIRISLISKHYEQIEPLIHQFFDNLQVEYILTNYTHQSIQDIYFVEIEKRDDLNILNHLKKLESTLIYIIGPKDFDLVSSDKETFSKGIELMKKNGVRFVDSYHLLDIIRSNKNLDQYIVAIEKEKKHD